MSSGIRAAWDAARFAGLLAVSLTMVAVLRPPAARAGEPALERAGAAMAVAPAPGRGAAKEDSTKRRSSPFRVMLRSAVLPGWGQVYNHKVWKAALVVGGEGFLVYKALNELSKENDAIDLQSTLTPGTPEYEAARAAQDEHYNLKINYIWWGIAVHLLQMADAYVDAHLTGFEADLGPGESEPGGRAGTRLALAYRVRF